MSSCLPVGLEVHNKTQFRSPLRCGTVALAIRPIGHVPFRIAALLLALLLSGTAPLARAELEPVQIDRGKQEARNPDPWEGFNRKVFAFNDVFDRYIGKPAAKGWRFLTPGWLDDGVTKIFANAKDLTSTVHGVLQWEWGNAANNFGRFTVNTTLGIAGFFDVATDMGLRKTNEDMGLTLARWGVKSGPYLVLPLLGSSTVRDGLAEWPNEWLRPHHYIEHEPTRHSVTAVYVVDLRADLLDLEKALSGDRYIFIRDLYLQSRLFASGQPLPEDDFGSDLPAGDWDSQGGGAGSNSGWDDEPSGSAPADDGW